MIKFILATTQDALDNALNNSEIEDASIVFVSEAEKEKLHTQGTDFLCVPSGGGSGQVLTNENGTPTWADVETLAEMQVYGVQWSSSSSDPTLTRIGSEYNHKNLPIQSQLKGCVVQFNDGEAELQYWLDSDNWAYKDGGNPDKGEAEQDARLDGYDGEVMVYVPEFYYLSYDGESDDDTRWVKISETQISDEWTKSPAMYISAYRATLLREVPEDMGYLSTLEAGTAISVMNTETYCRGGNNNSSYDVYLEGDDDTDANIYRTQLGKPASYLSRASMRTAARLSSGKEVMSYTQYKAIFWLWVIEYATFNSQLDFNEDLTSDGYHQGGLGAGPTTISDSFWSSFNSYYPLFPCGCTNELGNGTGEIDVTIPTHSSSYSDQSTTVIRYRGFENIFGDISHNIEGVNFGTVVTTAYNGYNNGILWYTDDPDLYGDSEPVDLTINTCYYPATDSSDTLAEYLEDMKNDFAESGTDFAYDYYDEDNNYYYRYVPFYGQYSSDSSSLGCTLGYIVLFINDGEISHYTYGAGTSLLDDGTIYQATSTGKYYISTSTGWDDVGDSFMDVVDYTLPDGYNYTLIGFGGSHYIKEFHLGTKADILERYAGSSGSSTTYKCDYHYANSGATTVRSLYFGGHASYGALAGLAHCYSHTAVSYANAYRGFRVSFVVNS